MYMACSGNRLLDEGCSLKCEFLVIKQKHKSILVSVSYCVGLLGDNCMGHICKTITLAPEITFN